MSVEKLTSNILFIFIFSYLFRFPFIYSFFILHSKEKLKYNNVAKGKKKIKGTIKVQESKDLPYSPPTHTFFYSFIFKQQSCSIIPTTLNKKCSTSYSQDKSLDNHFSSTEMLKHKMLLFILSYLNDWRFHVFFLCAVVEWNVYKTTVRCTKPWPLIKRCWTLLLPFASNAQDK